MMVAGELPNVANDGDVVDDVSFAQPMAGRQLFAVLCWTLLADVLVFRTLGYGGPGLFVALVPLLFLDYAMQWY